MVEIHCAVLGSPIEHSLSPVMHQAAYRELGLDWRYDKFDVPAGGLAAFVDGLDDSWRGLSVTMPLKREAAALATQRSPEVARTNVANTLIRSAAGWSALNTDIPGLCAALVEVGMHELESLRLLGAGATAISALEAVASMGCRTVQLVVRDIDRAAEAIETARRLALDISAVTFDDAALRAQVDLVVSTVPAAAIANLSTPPIAGAPVVFDAIYNPWPSPLAIAAAADGARVVSGLDLLAHQASLQVEAMTGLSVAADTLRRAALAQLQASGE